jgi:hypothetical protein
MIETNDKPTNKEWEGDEMTNTNEEEQTKPHATTRSKVGSNDVNTTPLEISYVEYIWNKVQWCHWNSHQVELKNQVDNRINMKINEQFWVT